MEDKNTKQEKKENAEQYFDFLGYNLKNASFAQGEDVRRHLRSFSILPFKPAFEANQIVTLDVTVELKGDDFKAEMTYRCKFHALNGEWLSQVQNGDPVLLSEMFAIVFPFIRESIFSLTNDTLGHIYLPILNLRDVAICQGVDFVRKTEADAKRKANPTKDDGKVSQ